MAIKNHEIIKIRNGIARQLRDTRVCPVSLAVFAAAQPLANRTAPQPARSFTGAAPHAAHLSLAQVEKLSGIPANIIDLLEVGIKPVDIGHLHQLAKAYGKAVKITLI